MDGKSKIGLNGLAITITSRHWRNAVYQIVVFETTFTELSSLKNVNQIFIIELTDIYRIVVFDD